MSDQPPPPKSKPGSLRDRIAAFEKPSTAPGPAPAPRPKPGGLSWKPKASSPPSSPGYSADHGVTAERKTGGMSASDAKESIGKGGSLKERMAALQGRGGFGAPPPVTAKPPLEKPKWKPPPVVSPPPDDKDEDEAISHVTTKEALPAATSPEDDSVKSTVEDEPVPTVESESAGFDPEEEERQRRAAIAARMARLGGARVGMAPPVFGKKPSVNKVETPNVEETKSLEHATPDLIADHASVKSPLTEEPPELDTQPTTDDSTARKKSESSSLHSVDSGSQAARTPGAMPVPAGPRRVAPPRKKVPKAPEAEPTPTVSEEAKEISDAPPVSDVEAPAATEVPVVDLEGGQEESAGDTGEETGDAKEQIEPVHAQEPAKLPEAPVEILAADPVEPCTPETPHIEGIHEQTVTGDTEGITAAKDDEEPLVRTPIDVGIPVDVKLEEEGLVSTNDYSPERRASDDISSPSQSREAVEDPLEKLTEEPEEEDEDSRRKRMAGKLAKMGGINPFAPPPPPPQRQPSMSSEDPPSVSPTVHGRASLRKESAGSLTSPISPDGKETSRKLSFDSTTVSADAPSSPRIAELTMDEIIRRASASRPSTQPFTRDDTTESAESGGNVSERTSQDESISGKGLRTVAGTEVLNYNPKIREPRDETLEERQELNSESERIDDAQSVEAQTHSVHPGAMEGTPAYPPAPRKNTRPRADLQAVEADSVISFAPPPPQSVVRAPENIGPSSPVVSPPSAPRLAPRTPDTNKEDTDVPEPVHAVAPRRSIPPPPQPLPQPSKGHTTDNQPPRRLPPPTISNGVGLNDEMAPSRTTSRPSVSSPSMPVPQSRQDENVTEPVTESITLSRPSRSIPPPPPPAPRAEEETVSAITAPPSRRPLPAQPLSQPEALSPVSPEQSSAPLITPTLSISDQEILDEEEGDPIDPTFHVPSRPPSTTNLREAASASPTEEPHTETQEGTDQSGRKTIAERMARLGGIKLGAGPLPAGPRSEDRRSDQPEAPAQEEALEMTEEEEEQARKQRIAAKLAGMGGMRFGMLPPSVGGLPPQQSRALKDNSEELPHTVSSPPPPPQRTAPPPRPPPPPQPQETDSEHESQSTSEDGVKVEAEESELEEVNYEDAKEPEVEPPPVPTRAGRRTSETQMESPSRKTSFIQGGRPPVPSTIPIRRASVQTATPTSRKSSADSGFSHTRVPSTQTRKPQSEYVMVEDPNTYESDNTAPPPPPQRPTSRAPRGVPPPPPAVDPANSVASQWELPSIPSSSLEFGAEGSLSLSTWSEDSTTYPKPSSPPPSAKQIAPKSTQLSPSRETSMSDVPKLSSDELMTIWGRVGVQICEVATSLFEKSKKSLVGDGTYHGFVQAVLSEVPNAALLSPPSYGHVVYLQAGSLVQKRVSEIMPGDIIALCDAKFKGHKGIQTYHQTVGAGEPLVGIVSEIEPKKSKIRVFQANQHVGQQTVETVSYRLEDLKSGTLEISRVLEA